MAISPQLAARLASTRTIDLTTVGRRSKQPRTVEIWWFNVEGRFIISGTPGRRDWLANVRENPSVTITAAGHILEGVALEIDDHDFRRRFFADPQTRWYSSQSELDRLVATAPMIEVSF